MRFTDQDTLPFVPGDAAIGRDAEGARRAQAWGAAGLTGRLDTLPGETEVGVHDAVALRRHLADRLNVVDPAARGLLRGAVEASLGAASISAQDRDAMIAIIRALPVIR